MVTAAAVMMSLAFLIYVESDENANFRSEAVAGQDPGDCRVEKQKGRRK